MSHMLRLSTDSVRIGSVRDRLHWIESHIGVGQHHAICAAGALVGLLAKVRPNFVI
jgi:hypothetical protein